MLMEKCYRFNICSAPICPLDPDCRKRVYYEGDPLCKADLRRVYRAVGPEFEKLYKNYTKVCLERGIKFTPWRKVKNEIRIW